MGTFYVFLKVTFCVACFSWNVALKKIQQILVLILIFELSVLFLVVCIFYDIDHFHIIYFQAVGR